MAHETYLFYEELDLYNRNIVDKHIKLYGGIKKWNDINQFLINEVHKKKTRSVRSKLFEGKFRIPDALTKRYYNAYLFNGKSNGGDWNTYFRRVLEDILVRDVSKRFDYTLIYYQPNRYTPKMKAILDIISTFDPESWKLDQCEHMTESDIETMKRYRQGFMTFLEQSLEIIKFSEDEFWPDGFDLCNREYRRMVRVMDKV